MSFKKKVTLTIMMMVSILCLIFGAVACSNGNTGGGGMSAKEAIERYILPQNQTLVDADFTLPKTIGSAESPITVEWKSDNTAAIAIEDKGENYNAKVTIQDEVTDVKLTISADGNSKDFTVRVDGFSVYTFLDNYNFPQRMTSVKEDFDLVTKTSFQGKTATISWAIDEKYSAFIALNEAKNKVLVTPGEDIANVEIEATFSYNGETATQKYPFSVVPLLEHRQTVNRLYSIVDYPLELSGYIVHVVEASESYGNATFYMIDDDFCSGYYCYRVKINTADIAKYVEGAHVTVSGDKTKNYNGLWENNSGGTAVVDDKTSINPREKVYAMDTDLLAGVPSLLWHESTFVSLSGWKVASKADSKPTAADTNLFTLEKDGTTITVRITKYMQRTDAELAALCDVYDSVNEGDFVNVTGILGNYNGFQIQPVVATDITKVSAEGTNTDGAKVKAAVKAVDDAVKANFSSLIAAAKEVTMPTSVEGVTISYRVAGAANPTVVINGGKFTIDPVDSEKNYDIEVTYTIGDYKAYDFFKLHNWKQSSEQIVDNVKAALEEAKLAEVKHTGEFDLPVVDDLGTTITWSVKAPAPDWISIADGKIKVTALPAEDTEVTLVATIALDGQTATAKLTLKVAAASAVAFKAIDAPAAGTYKLAMDKNGTMLYFSGEMDGFYYGTVTEAENAADVVLAGSTSEGWTLKTGNKFLEIEYAKGTDGNMHTNVKLMDAQTAGKTWTWDATNKVFTWIVDVDGTPTTYFLGTDSSKNYTTISANTIDKISSYCTAKLGEMAAAELTFKAIDAPAAGDYIFAAMHKGERLYASSLELDGSYIATTNDETMAVKLTIEKKDNAWLIKMGAKYLEVNPYNNSKGGVSYNLRLVDSATEGAVWEWDSDIKIFKQKPVATEEGVTPADAYFYIGMRDDADFVTMSPSDIKYITGSNASKLDVTQHPSRFGEMVVGEPGTTEPEPELPEGGTQDDPYTVAEALTVAQALASGAYSETAVYIKGFVVDAGSWSDQYGNWSSIYLADAKDAKKADGIQLYRLNPDDTYLKLPNDLTVGAEITVCGYLQNYNGNTPEIAPNGKTNVTVISYSDPRTAAEKIQAALNAVTLPDKLAADLDMPASTVTGVTLTYTSNNQAITVGESKFTVTRGATDVSVEITVSANAEGGTAQTKKLTVVVRASSSVLVSLSFADKDETRTSQSDEEQVWEQNGITFTNQKGSSTNKVGDYGNPVRVYANSSVKIEYTSAMTEIVFHCNSASYATALQKSLGEIEGATVTLSGSVVYVVFATARAEFEFTATAQLRFDSIEVVYSAGGAGPAADEGFHFTMSTADIIGTWVSEDGHKVVITETTFLFTDPTGAKCTYTLTETQRGSFYNYSILWNGETYTIDSTGPTTLAFLKADGSPAYTFTKESGSQGGVSFPEQLQGTFACTMAMIDEEPVEDLSSIPALVVTANGITWGTHSVTILGGDMGNYGLQIDGAEYTLMYTGSGWMLASENAMYTFGNGGAGPELGL